MTPRRIVGLIPARLGSVRVRCKALRMLAGQPLIAYTIQTLRASTRLDASYVNSESDIIGSVAARYGVQFYQRPAELATSSSMIDEYIYDFVKHVPCDVLAVVNPTSPFLTTAEVDAAIDHFTAHDYDTQLACTNFRTHCFLHGQPINFTTAGKHPRSQDLPPVQGLNFAVTIWKAATFIRQFEEKGYAVYSGKIGLYAFEGLATLDIDWEEDFQIADAIMSQRRGGAHAPAQYDRAVAEIIARGDETAT